MRGEEEALKPEVLKVLQNAPDPVTHRRLASIVGLPEVWTVKAIVKQLKAEGHDIRGINSRGVWLYDKGPPPPRKPAKVVESAEYRRKYALNRPPETRRIERIRYPVDWSVLKQVLADRKLTPYAATQLAMKYGWKSAECSASRIADMLRKDTSTLKGRRGMTWTKIWALAQALRVAPEILVDERAATFRYISDVMPDRFAGYKLLFGAAKKGIHPVELVPPFSSSYDKIEDLRAHPERHFRIISWLARIFKGLFTSFHPPTILYMCSRVGVSVGELFASNRAAVSMAFTEIASLERWDVLFLASIAKLLYKCGDIGDDELALGIARLVEERNCWKARLQDAKKREKRGTLAETADS